MLHDHQHGDRDVSCKPAIANRPLPHSCKQKHQLEARGGQNTVNFLEDGHLWDRH